MNRKSYVLPHCNKIPHVAFIVIFNQSLSNMNIQNKKRKCHLNYRTLSYFVLKFNKASVSKTTDSNNLPKKPSASQIGALLEGPQTLAYFTSCKEGAGHMCFRYKNFHFSMDSSRS